jgi:hypothetical protein
LGNSYAVETYQCKKCNYQQEFDWGFHGGAVYGFVEGALVVRGLPYNAPSVVKTYHRPQI